MLALEINHFFRNSSLQNSGFSFIFYFLKIRVPARVFPLLFLFEVLSSDQDFLLNPMLALEINHFFRNSSLQNSGFSFIFYFLKIRVPARVFPLLFSFEVLSSDQDFLLNPMLTLGPIDYVENSSFPNSKISLLSFILNIRVPTRVLSFYFIFLLKNTRVPTWTLFFFKKPQLPGGTFFQNPAFRLVHFKISRFRFILSLFSLQVKG